MSRRQNGRAGDKKVMLGGEGGGGDTTRNASRRNWGKNHRSSAILARTNL